MVKGKIRHIAISVPDPWKAAEFYKHVFGLEVIGETDGELSPGVFLTDGVINLALLKFRSDEAAQGTGKDFVGFHHIGFWIDDVEDTQARVEEAGGTWIMGEKNPQHGGFYEIKYHDRDGLIFDISHNGWGGAQKNPGGADNQVGKVRPMLPQFEERRKQAAKELSELVASRAPVPAK